MKQVAAAKQVQVQTGHLSEKVAPEKSREVPKPMKSAKGKADAERKGRRADLRR